MAHFMVHNLAQVMVQVTNCSEAANILMNLLATKEQEKNG
jgi:hypothetical protein